MKIRREQFGAMQRPPWKPRRKLRDSLVAQGHDASLEAKTGDLLLKTTDPGFASTHGDLAINDYMSATLAHTPALISPIRFHNSVHNAAAGYWSIGTGSMQPYTALTAWGDTFGEGLLEALVQAEAGGRPVLLVAYDIEARGPLTAMQPSRGIVGAGLVVAPGASPATLARLRWRTARGTERTRPRDSNAELVAGNAMAGCLPFYDALAMREPRPVRIGLSPCMLLELEFDFPVRNEGSGS